jgi:hypothetical protein
MTDAFLLMPYVAIGACVALAATVSMVCFAQPTPRMSGFSV